MGVLHLGGDLRGRALPLPLPSLGCVGLRLSWAWSPAPSPACTSLLQSDMLRSLATTRSYCEWQKTSWKVKKFSEDFGQES